MMPIEDDAWGTPVPDVEPEATAPTPPPSGSGSGSRTPIFIGGAVVVVIVVVIIIAGSGGGGSSGGLSKAAWIAKADAICGKNFPIQAQDQSQNNVAAASQNAQETLTQIRALGLPSSGAAAVKSFESQEQHATDLIEQAVSAESSDPTTAQSDLQQAQSVIGGASRAAGQFGMQVCNSGQ
jgi:hypothetical protein